MDTVKSIFKFMAVSTLVVGGVLVGGTILTAKGIDKAGDNIQAKLHG
ncbi:hypothetical protein [Companilactobacillus kimchii]|uniref:Uncharacterized protein n=1 Tax=Companilactobacillus kimchii TaxID=2801452 RepID=A0A210P5S9_9LACO|nr:hypothetical protein [Companilactobacillus kimchii]OWF31846.1 hypothetical protein LKACC12383_02652 [Companilactobacillus kimchii]GEO48616.1 hypothetical protein LKI01_26150 [Companilactobacillus paralimentarius]